MMGNILIFINLLFLTFGHADNPPAFKGGGDALNNFFNENLVYPEYSRQNCISGTIQVRFNIDKAGKLYNVKVYKGLGIDLDDEAVRVVKLTKGKWTVPEDHNPDVYMIMPVQFRSEDTRCQTKDAQSIDEAITAYKARGELVNAVTNYYANKYIGKSDTLKEQQIITLKEQLGFDDDFVDHVLKQANRKLKQGDKEGACADWHFIKNIGSNSADGLMAKYCN